MVADSISETTTERCPRCGGGFHCGVNDARPCACTALRLSATVLAELRERYASCLCLVCLAELAEQEKSRSDQAIGRP